jgi:hypothetical protein
MCDGCSLLEIGRTGVPGSQTEGAAAAVVAVKDTSGVEMLFVGIAPAAVVPGAVCVEVCLVGITPVAVVLDAVFAAGELGV